MATHRSQRDNADAFDDLLGQLVDELAMRPTMVPEVEPPPPPPVAVAVAPVAYQIPVQEMAPPRRNFMGFAVGGGIAIAGIAIAVVMMGRGDPQPVAQQAAVAAVAPTVAAKPVPVQPVVAPVPVPAPVVTPPGMPVGTGLPGQVIDPGALAQAGPPAVQDPAAVAATPGREAKKVVKKTAPAPKKTAPTKKTKVVDPFE